MLNLEALTEKQLPSERLPEVIAVAGRVGAALLPGDFLKRRLVQADLGRGHL